MENDKAEKASPKAEKEYRANKGFAYEYGFALGFADGLTAARKHQVDHRDLLSASDPYAKGYRKGLSIELNPITAA